MIPCCKIVSLTAKVQLTDSRIFRITLLEGEGHKLQMAAIFIHMPNCWKCEPLTPTKGQQRA